MKPAPKSSLLGLEWTAEGAVTTELTSESQKEVVVVAGASGFVGRVLIPLLLKRYKVIALGRNIPEKSDHPDLEWRSCNLFSLLQAEEAIQNAKYAFYLVHSMAPSELTQAGFRDIDWILADNFARACDLAGVEQIIYLGGLIPSGQKLSEHLTSRYEVAQVLGARKPAVTVLQAGLIIGEGGSSFRIMYRLVQRLPVMLCPKWTSSQTQPIAVEDVVALLAGCVGKPEFYGQWYDIGGPDRMSYIEMMQTTAGVMGLKRRIGSVPVFSLWLSLHWIQLITGASKQLVEPLIESLRHDMVVQENRLQKRLGIAGIPFVESLKRAFRAEQNQPSRRSALRLPYLKRPTKQKVCSIQRLELSHSRSAQDIALDYAKFLTQFLGPWLNVEVDGDHCMSFRVFGLRKPLLKLSYAPDRSEPRRALYYIEGGILANMVRMGRSDNKGRLEFRLSNCGTFVLAAIFDFAPRLPWSIYRLTQAPFHLWVMNSFGRYLQEQKPAASTPLLSL